MITDLTDYFLNIEDDNTNTPKNICPNCWGKQEWDNEFYNHQKANPTDKTYTSFVKEIASKLGKITLNKDSYTCETCKGVFK